MGKTARLMICFLVSFLIGTICSVVMISRNAKANEERYVQGLKDLHWAKGQIAFREILTGHKWTPESGEPVASLSVYP